MKKKKAAKKSTSKKAEKEVKVVDESTEEVMEPEWTEQDFEGQLSVDVYQEKNNIVIKSTIAGVKPENIDISINDDVLTIRGFREQEESIAEEDYFYQECYWGGFSRSITLPAPVSTSRIKATLKDGVLTIVLPLARGSRPVKIKVKGGR